MSGCLPAEPVNFPGPLEPDPDTVPVESARGKLHAGQVIEVEFASGNRNQQIRGCRLNEPEVIGGVLHVSHDQPFQLMVTMSP